MLCNITGTMILPDGTDATGIYLNFMPSLRGVVLVEEGSSASINKSFRVGQGGDIDIVIQSGEYTVRIKGAGDTVIYVPNVAAADVSEVFPINFPEWDYELTILQGDSISLKLVYTDDYGVAKDLTGVTVTAEVEVPGGANVDLDYAAESEAAGIFYLLKEDTSLLDSGIYNAKVSFDDGGLVNLLRFKVTVV